MHKLSTRHNGKTRYNLQGDLDKIKSALSTAGKHAKGRAQDMLYESYDNIVDKTWGVQDTVISYARQKPIKSLGIAMAAGLVVGFLLRK